MQRFSTEGIAPGWLPAVRAHLESEAGLGLMAALRARLSAGAVVYPPDPWRALRGAGPESVRAVILGQDPYHEPGQATGLAFSVPPGLKRIPPSLRNIMKELALEHGRPVSGAGDLSAWAAQGVLLLNAVLTVERGRAGAHAGLGWEGLTDRLLAAAAAAPGPRAYLLWGRWAQSKEACIRAAARGPALILKANHPSPLSATRPPAPFIGCGHFREASDWLAAQGAGPVDWLAPWREAPAQPRLL